MDVQSHMKQDKHCIRVNQVYDWINRFLAIKQKELIVFPHPSKVLFKDSICCNFKIRCNDPNLSTIYTSCGIEQLTATITIKFKCVSSCKMEIYINGESATTILNNQTFSGTVSDLKNIEVRCFGEDEDKQICYGELNIDFSYCSIQKVATFDFNNIDCFLSDKYGNPISTKQLHCEELKAPHGRPDIMVNIPEKKHSKLKQIHLFISGYITVVFYNFKKEICKICTFPFSTIEQFYLCAPKDSKVDFYFTDISCSTFILPKDPLSNCLELLLSITFCIQVATIVEKNISIHSNICNPRKEFQFETTCFDPTLPKSCSFI